MVIHDLDIMRIAVRPTKADSPLIVDPDAVLSRPIALEPLEPIAGWHAKVIERFGGIDNHQLAQHGSQELGRVAAHPFSTKEALSVPVAEALDHLVSI